MANRAKSEDETEELRSAVLQTATSVLQIRHRAEQEIRQAKEALEQRTRGLAYALVVMRATLESTTDAILVTDEEGKVTDFNAKYLDMWKIPRVVLEDWYGRRCARAREPELCGSAAVLSPHRGNCRHPTGELRRAGAQGRAHF